MYRAAARRLRRAARRRRAQSWEFEQRLTWILGSPRSGSTWLLKLLAEHREVATINEPLIGWYLGPFMCDLPGGEAAGLDLTNFSLRRVQSAQRASFFADDFRYVWQPRLGQMMRERFYEHVVREERAGSGKCRIVAIKEPNGSQSADMIMPALPSSRLLFLLRDGRDVVDSELAGNRAGAWVTREFPGLRGIDEDERRAFVIQSAHKWLWRTEVVQRAFAEHPGRKVVLRYEDLLLDPQARLAELFRWLDLEVTYGQLAGWIGRNRFGGAAAERTGPGEFARSATPGGWRANLTGDEQAVIAEILGPKLREFGYPD